MVPADNPAGRLYDLLATVSRFGRPGGSIRDAWAKTFDLEPSNVTSTFQRIAEVQRLTRDVRQVLETDAYDGHGPYLQNFAKIESFVALTNLDQAAPPQVNAYLDAVVMRDLEYASHHLSRTRGETIIEEDSLAEFVADINSVSEKLRSSDLDPGLRAVLLDLLEAMHHAVSQYRIHGAEAFRKALVLCIGEIQMVQDLWKRNDDKPAVKGFKAAMGKLYGFAKHASTLSTLALNAHNIVALLPPALGGGS